MRLIFRLFRSIERALLVALLLLLLTSTAAAKGIAVVVQQEAKISAMTRQELTNLFLGGGRARFQLTPFDRSDPQLRKQFYREVANLSLTSVRARWAQQVFSGRGRPPATLSVTELSTVLENVAGAISYAPVDHLPNGCKVLLVLESGEQK